MIFDIAFCWLSRYEVFVGRRNPPYNLAEAKLSPVLAWATTARMINKLPSFGGGSQRIFPRRRRHIDSARQSMPNLGRGFFGRRRRWGVCRIRLR
jgi:hypothetical protein